MSKRAEEAALKAYPVEMTPLNYLDLIEQFGGKTAIDVNTYPRCRFQEGYEQAEKDLKLTADDIGAILELYLQLMRDEKYRNIGRDAICDEVLKRFYELDKNEQPNLS